MKAVICLLIFSIFSLIHGSNIPSCKDYSTSSWQSKTLDGIYNLKWKVNSNAQNIELYLNVTGQYYPTWIGFGISETGHMLGSDIVSVSHVNDEFIVADRYVPWAATPLLTAPLPFPEIDNHADWNLLCADVSDTSIQAIVSRLLDTGDEQDRPFTDQPLPCVYAHGSSNDLVAYHGGSNRGTTTIQFYGSVAEYPPSDAVGYTILQYDPGFVTEGLLTNYICQSFYLGDENYYKQIVAYEGFLNGSSIANSLTHHILLHDVTGGEVALGWYDYYEQALPCQTLSLSSEGSSLLGSGANLMAGWALGGTPLIMPDEAGILVGPTIGRYVIMELHVNNPTNLKGIDMSNVGLKLWYNELTLPRKRKYFAGTIAVGDPLVTFPDVTIGPSVSMDGTCPSVCTAGLNDTLYIYGSFMHMHAVGREMVTSIYRTETDEYSIVEKRQFWNNGFQVISPISNFVSPGDRITTRCTYDTSKQTIPVTFGSASYNEMCIHFLFVYPYKDINYQTFLCGYDFEQTLCGPSGGDYFSYANPSTSDNMTAIAEAVFTFGTGGSTVSPTTSPTSSPITSAPTSKPTSQPELKYHSFGNAFKASVAVCGAALLIFIGFQFFYYMSLSNVSNNKRNLEIKQVESHSNNDLEMVNNIEA